MKVYRQMHTGAFMLEGNEAEIFIAILGGGGRHFSAFY